RPLLPVGARGDEAVEVLAREAPEARLPRAFVGLQLVGDVDHLHGVELSERARAEAAEGVTDAVEEPDLGLPRRLVSPGLAEEPVDERGRLHADLGRLPPE